MEVEGRENDSLKNKKFCLFVRMFSLLFLGKSWFFVHPVFLYPALKDLVKLVCDFIGH